jgi:glycosyltransferase involved in cell wall biosynthesis
MEAGGADSLLRSTAAHGGPDSERVNVLFLMIHMAMGGTEHLILDLARNLDRRVFSPSVAWFVEDQPLEEFAKLQIPLYHIPKRKRFDWNAMVRISTLVRRHRIDIINAHHFMPFFYAHYAAKLANRAKLVYTEHSEADVLKVGGKSKAIGRCLLASCDAVVGVSDRVSQTLTSHFHLRPERVHTIENGVDTSLYTAGAPERLRWRQAFGLGPGDFVIGHVANFRRNKNHMFLLRAFRELVSRRDHVRLVLVGQGFPGDPDNSEQEIKDYISAHQLDTRVRLAGYRPNVQELLQMMDVFCLVSYKEGLPLSVIEAMASGLPVIGTDIEGIRSVISPEINGLMVAPDDVRGLTRTLERLIDDAALRERMGAASRRITTEQYSLTRCLEQTHRLFLSTVAA